LTHRVRYHIELFH